MTTVASDPKDKDEGIPADLPAPRRRRKKVKKVTTRRASTANSKKIPRAKKGPPKLPGGPAKTRAAKKAPPKHQAGAKSPPRKTGERRAPEQRITLREPSEVALGEHLNKKRPGRRKPSASQTDPVMAHPPHEGPLFTEDRRATVLKLIQDGSAQAYAAHIAGIGRRTLQDWLYRGRKLRDAHETWQRRVDDGEAVGDVLEETGPDPGLDDYAIFAIDYDKAEALSIVDVTQCILDRALARDGFVLGGSVVVVEERGFGKKKITVRTSTTVRNGTIECAMWWAERRDNRMFGRGAARPRPDDERDEFGKREDPVGALLEHVLNFFGNAPPESA